MLIGLCLIVITANAGSSATANTTITTNIVPAASFSISNPIVLTQHTGNRHRNLVSTQLQHTIKSTSDNRVILNTVDTIYPPKLRINSTQKLTYDISMPPLVSASGYERNITANINNTSWKDDQPDVNAERLLKIDGTGTNNIHQDAGTYHGTIDITVNYN